MYKIYLSLPFLLLSFFASFGQSHLNIGTGYFGHTITHPGIVLELEKETFFTNKASIPVRIDLGFFNHPRNHTGIFADANIGFRRHYQSGLFLEESIGIGIFEGILNSDGVFEVNQEGIVSESSRWMAPDFMPSVTLGAGYTFNEKVSVWVRPKLYWQIPHKTSSTWNPVLQVGFSYRMGE